MSQTFSLSKETSLSLKGIFCIGIVLHHLAQRTSIGFLQPLCSAGTFLVAGFFFLSGYGLMAQLQEKRQRLPRRVFPAANRQSRPALCARHDFLCAVFLPRAWAARLFLSSIRSSRGILSFPFPGMPWPLCFLCGVCPMLFPHGQPGCGIFRFFYSSCQDIRCSAWRWALRVVVSFLPGFSFGHALFRPFRNQVLLFSLAGLPMLCAALWLLRQNAAAALLAKISGICAVTALLFLPIFLFPLNKKSARWLGERSLYFYLLQKGCLWRYCTAAGSLCATTISMPPCASSAHCS